MHLTIYIDNHANIKSCRKLKVDVEKDLGHTPKEWEEMSEDDRYESVCDYWRMLGVPEIYWEEV